LSQALIFIPYYININPVGVGYARHAIAEILEDFTEEGEEFQVSSRLYISKEIEELGAFRQQTALVKLQLMLRRLGLRGAQRQRR
jgi:hypothetical protein